MVHMEAMLGPAERIDSCNRQKSLQGDSICVYLRALLYEIFIGLHHSVGNLSEDIGKHCEGDEHHHRSVHHLSARVSSPSTDHESKTAQE